MSYFSRKQSDSRFSLIRLVFSFGLPLLLLLAFLGRQFLDFNDIGLSNGFSHPLTGWDHLVTMLAVGIWAAQLRGKAIWMLPLAFVGVMSLGGLAGASSQEIPNVDGIILISCAVFSVLITRKIRFSNKINVLIVAFFAFFHGFAHGQEISTSASLISYTVGFMLATLLLHGAGILVAKLVVLAITCLLTVLFSSSALAKTAESVIDIKDNNFVVNQFQDTVNLGYVWLTPQQRSYEVKSLDFYGNRGISKDFAKQDAGGGALLSGTGKLSLQASGRVNGQNISHLGKQSAGADYHVVTVKESLLNVCENSINKLFYPRYSSDCSNLDFKNYFPKINHTPGRHFLSNGVGLTSPPESHSFFAVPRQFQNTHLSLIEASSLQLSFARFPIGNSVIKSLGPHNRHDLSLAISIIGYQFVPSLRDEDEFNSFAPLFTYCNSPSFFATGNINNLHCLSVIPIIPLFSEGTSVHHNFFSRNTKAIT